jgi:hypothetical protein
LENSKISSLVASVAGMGTLSTRAADRAVLAFLVRLAGVAGWLFMSFSHEAMQHYTSRI